MKISKQIKSELISTSANKQIIMTCEQWEVVQGGVGGKEDEQ